MYIFLLLTLLAADPLFAQFYLPQLSKPGRNNGGDISFPMQVILDKSYRYWVATFNGLLEYEGSTFKSHHMPLFQGKLMGSDYLSRLVQTNDSTVWIAHENGIATFNLYRKTFELIPIRDLRPGSSLSFIYAFKDSEGRPIFISTEMGPLYFNAATRQIEPLSNLAKEAGAFVFKISETSDKKHYLLHTRKGLVIYDHRSGKRIGNEWIPPAYQWINRSELKGAVTDYIEFSGKKYISIKDDNKAYYEVLEYDPVKQSFRSIALKSNKGRMFFGDSQGRLWIYGFGDQPAVYDPVSGQVYSLPDKNNSSGVDFSLCYHVMEDHEGNLWVCTNTGIYTYNQYQNTFRILSEKLPTNIFSDIAQVNPDEIWFGTLYNGLYKYNVLKEEFENINFLPLCNDASYNDIWQIQKSSDKRNVWVIHANAKVSRYDIEKRKFFFYKQAPFKGDFVSMCDDEQGNTFFATQDGTIFRYRPARNDFDSLFSIAGLAGISNDVEVNDVLSISNDDLLIGTAGEGLVRINLKEKTHRIFRIEPGKESSLRSNIINVLKKFDSDIVFAGTTNGIFAYNIHNDSIESFSYGERFNLGNVFQITKDKNDNLIFTGTSKMYLLNWKTKDITDLGQKSNISNSNLTEVYFSKSLDKLYVLSEESIYEIKLRKQDRNPEIKPVIYSLDSYGKIIYTKNGDNVFLKTANNSFGLNFGASTFKFRDDLEYYYSLNSEDWQKTEGPYITFSKLPGGDYLFKLKVVYTGNKSISAETFLNIHIQKKFQETIWFYLLIFLLVFALVFVFYRIRLNRIIAVEKVRFQLSRDLHDDMGSTLSTINILSSIATGKLADNPAALQYVQRISQNSQQMMESMDDIVWSINPANDSMKKVIYRMREFASGILEPKGIILAFESDDRIHDLKLNMAYRRDFFLIFKEAINNAVKYSECNRIRVKFFTDQKYLILLIQDNGKGFNIEEQRDGNGLVNMRKRAANIQALFNIESLAGEGTSIEIKLDLKKL